MKELEKIKAWLLSYPGWEGTLVLDHTEQALGSNGLFPVGVQVLHRQEDVVGNWFLRLRSTCLLRRVSTVTEGADWMAAFARWVQDQDALGNSPRLGNLPNNEHITAEKGRLEKRDPGGTATYSIKLVCEYTRVYPAG